MPGPIDHEIRSPDRPAPGPDGYRRLDPQVVGELIILTRRTMAASPSEGAASSPQVERFTVVTGRRAGTDGMWQPPSHVARHIEHWLLPGWSAPARLIPRRRGRTGMVNLDFDVSLEDRKAALAAIRVERDAQSVTAETVRGSE